MDAESRKVEEPALRAPYQPPAVEKRVQIQALLGKSVISPGTK